MAKKPEPTLFHLLTKGSIHDIPGNIKVAYKRDPAATKVACREAIEWCYRQKYPAVGRALKAFDENLSKRWDELSMTARSSTYRRRTLAANNGARRLINRACIIEEALGIGAMNPLFPEMPKP